VRHLVRILIIAAVSFIFCSHLNAQLCQGSLGDPIVNITFGAGANPGAPLKAATTSYQYFSSDCPGDGFYTVRSNTTNCFGSTWHSLNNDHTGDPNGYFMLINASFQPSAFYLDTVRGLCGGTTYEFAAWVVNVLKTTACSPNAIQPNLTFTIESTAGDVLKSYNTNTINSQATPAWQQFGFFFTTPANASDIVLRIFNNAPGGCGNDLALDDITFRPCGPQLAAAITGHPSPSATICEGTARSFTFTCTVSAGYNSPSFQWQQSSDGMVWTDIPGATNTTLAQAFQATTPTGDYLYRLSAAEAGSMNSPQCRIVSKPLTIKIAADPVTMAGSNSPACENNTLVLSASGGSQYQWSGVNNFSATGSSVSVGNVKVMQSGKYYVEVTDVNGCKNIDSLTAIVNPAPVVLATFPSTTICEGEDVQLGSSGGNTYLWAPATGLSSDAIADPIASPVASTEYSVIASNQFNCRDTATVMVNVVEAPRADAGSDKWIIKGTSVQLTASASGQNVTYSWSPPVFISDPLSLQPVINPPRDTMYVLTVVSNDGCGTDIDTMQVFVYKDVYIPTAFSPNYDGLNDTWNIPALAAYPDFELTVFNRQGQIVFQNKKSLRPWDGSYKGMPQPLGMYVYVIDLKVGDKILKGSLMLVR
jgi:gliding motility-associated-like protein